MLRYLFTVDFPTSEKKGKDPINFFKLPLMKKMRKTSEKRTFEASIKEGIKIKRSQNILGNHRVWWW